MSAGSFAPDISVVVPTHNRRDSVLRLINALGAGTFPSDRFEIIVVCDGCTDETVATLTALDTRFHMLVLEQTPGRGAASARNLGARRARGALLFFIDDDIEPLPRLIETHVQLHRETLGSEPRVVVGAPLPVRAAGARFGQIAVWGWWEQQFERMQQRDHRFTYAEVFSGILSVQSSMFAESGGFEPALNSCRDDSELGLRLIRLGARVVFSREGGGYHHEMRNHTQLLSRKRAEGRADVMLAQKYPELWPGLHLAAADTGTLVLRGIRWVAVHAPVLGDAIQRVSSSALELLEQLRLRGTWRALHACSLYYAYWRGARDTLGGASATRQFTHEHRATGAQRTDAAVDVEIDLSGGIHQAATQLDRERPHSARVRLGDTVVGHFTGAAGAEPLRAVHMCSNLSKGGPLTTNLAFALALRDLEREPAVRRRLAVDSQLGHPICARLARRQLTTTRPLPQWREPAEWPPISVVVCTKNRATAVTTCLTSLQQLDYPQYEVVIVDNASTTDATQRVTSAFAARYVREDKPGLDWARNRGITESTHDIIAFTDDDVRVDAGWLRGIARAFSDPDVMLVTGLIAPAELVTAAQTTFEYGYGGMGKAFVERRWDPNLLDARELLSSHELGAGANMAFRREVFARVGTFDTALDVGTPSHGAGDLDMFHRVLAAGLVAYYQPDALVWHYHRRDLTGLRRQLRDNGRSFGAYLITRWVAARRGVGGLSSFDVVRYALRTWLGWRIERIVRRFMRRDLLPLPLQAEELLGALQAPWAYAATRRNDKRLRAQNGLPNEPFRIAATVAEPVQATRGRIE